jgi:hypothetical protein
MDAAKPHTLRYERDKTLLTVVRFAPHLCTRLTQGFDGWDHASGARPD